MTIRPYEIRGNEFVPLDAMVTSPAPGSRAWSHAVAPDRETLRQHLREFGAPADIALICTQDNLHPEFLVTEGWHLLTFPVQVPGTWTRAYLVVVRHGST